MGSELETARARIAALEALCADAYQLAGTIGAPARFLDALWAAAQGGRIPKTHRLPVALLECDEVRVREEQLAEVRKVLGVSAAAELGRVGGSKRSHAKRRAARENGKKGGRPRTKVVTSPPPGTPGYDPSTPRPADVWDPSAK